MSRNSVLLSSKFDHSSVFLSFRIRTFCPGLGSNCLSRWHFIYFSVPLFEFKWRTHRSLLLAAKSGKKSTEYNSFIYCDIGFTWEKNCHSIDRSGRLKQSWKPKPAWKMQHSLVLFCWQVPPGMTYKGDKGIICYSELADTTYRRRASTSRSRLTDVQYLGSAQISQKKVLCYTK